MRVSFLKSGVAAAMLMAAASANADTLYAASSSQIAVIDTLNLGAVSYINLSGLGSGERLLGIDVRPSNGLAYVVTSTDRLLTVDLMTGSTSFVANLVNAPMSTGFTGLNGQSVGLDFNPQADFAGAASLRLVTGAGKNYAVNATTGVVGNASASITGGYNGVAYTNSAPGLDPRDPGNLGADVTDLYYINSTTDTLAFAPGAFNAPMIMTVGGLGVDAITANGFDILGNGNAYALLDVTGALESNLYSINLTTGAATYLATLNGPFNGLTGLAAPVPEPESYAMFMIGLGLIAGLTARKSKK